MIKKFENFDEFKYENIRSDAGTFVGIEVSIYGKLIGSISIGITRDKLCSGCSDSDEKFNKLTYNSPFIHNVAINSWYLRKGIATNLYNKLFLQLKVEGYNIVYSGITRNSNYINNIWNKIKDGEVDINNHQIFYKKL
jgi:hypothetical protein